MNLNRPLCCCRLLPILALLAAARTLAADTPRLEATALLSRLYPDNLQALQMTPRMPSVPELPGQSAPASSPPLAADPVSSATMQPAALTTAGTLVVVAPPVVPFEKIQLPPPPAPSLRDMDGAMLVSPSPNTARPSPAAIGTNHAVSPRDTAAVRVNSAGAAELAAKLKIDARRARFIMEFRRAYGPFKTFEDLAQVNGITDTMLEDWEMRNAVALD